MGEPVNTLFMEEPPVPFTGGLVYKDLNMLNSMDFDLEPVVQSAIKGWATEANARNYKGGQYDNFRSPNIIYYSCPLG